MAERDIMPFDSVHGGHTRVMGFNLNASEGFFVGEVVSVNTAG